MNKHLARILVALTVAMMTVAQPIASVAVQATETQETENNDEDVSDTSEDGGNVDKTTPLDKSGTQNETGKTNDSSNAGNSSSETPAAATRTYVFKNGDATVSQQTITSGGAVSKPSDPTADGKVFEGWFSDVNNENTKFTSFDTAISFDATETIALYAKFTDAAAEQAAEQTTEQKIQAIYDRLMKAASCSELEEIQNSLTEDERSLMESFTSAQNEALTKLAEKLGAYGTNETAGNEQTVEVGSTTTLNGEGKRRINHKWTSSNTSIATVSSGDWYGQTSTATVTGVGEGDVTITHSYGAGLTAESETFTVHVKQVTGTVTVYVYVASSGFSDEMYELLGIDKSTLDGNGYFPAGSIEVAKSFFVGKSTNPGTGLIEDQEDWNTLLAALGSMNTTLTATNQPTAGTGTVVDYTKNNGNYVGSYLKQAVVSYGSGWGSQSTALFHWHNSGVSWGQANQHYGFTDQSVQYHLDLKFDTRTINFITGNNGITAPDYAKDGAAIDTRTYITGSNILDPRNLKIPDGYQFMGYYKDADFTEKWDGIGTPLNNNQTVYVKITEKENIVLNYVVATGEETGSVSVEQEKFNPDTGAPKGSVAAAKDGYTFDGWYTDAECTNRIEGAAENYVPAKPTDGWVTGTTYYAKFIPANKDLTITKTLSGNMYDASKVFTFTVTSDRDMTMGSGDQQTTGKELTFTLGKDASKVISVPAGAAVTVIENKDSYTQTVTAEGLTYEAAGEGENIGIKFTMPSSDISITFDNSKNATPDTGISLDSLPYLVILALVAVGIVIFIRKRRRSFDD